MLKRVLSLAAALAVVVFVGAAVAAEKAAADNNTHTGTVVTAADGKLTMTGKDGKEHTHAVAKDAKISCDGKECKLEDLKKDQTVTVTVEKQGEANNYLFGRAGLVSFVKGSGSSDVVFAGTPFSPKGQSRIRRIAPPPRGTFYTFQGDKLVKSSDPFTTAPKAASESKDSAKKQ